MKPQFLLVGDSHVEVVQEAAATLGCAFAGGMLAVGRALNLDFFDPQPDDFAFRDEVVEARWRVFLAQAGASSARALRIPLVSTIGFNVHRWMRRGRWESFCIGEDDPGRTFISQNVLEQAVLGEVQGAIAFYEHALDLGVSIAAVAPPQRWAGAEPAFFNAGQAILRRVLAGLGVPVIDVSPLATGADGQQRPEYCSTRDMVHGNTAFGLLILQQMERKGLISLAPPSAATGSQRPIALRPG